MRVNYDVELGFFSLFFFHSLSFSDRERRKRKKAKEKRAKRDRSVRYLRQDLQIILSQQQTQQRMLILAEVLLLHDSGSCIVICFTHHVLFLIVQTRIEEILRNVMEEKKGRQNGSKREMNNN